MTVAFSLPELAIAATIYGALVVALAAGWWRAERHGRRVTSKLIGLARVARRFEALNNALTEDLGIARADVAKWSSKWGRAMQLLRKAEGFNRKLLGQVFRFEQEVGE